MLVHLRYLLWLTEKINRRKDTCHAVNIVTCHNFNVQPIVKIYEKKTNLGIGKPFCVYIFTLFSAVLLLTNIQWRENWREDKQQILWFDFEQMYTNYECSFVQWIRKIFNSSSPFSTKWIGNWPKRIPIRETKLNRLPLHIMICLSWYLSSMKIQY